MSDKSFFLGIDAGATKTHAFLIDNNGQMVSSAKAPDGNFHNVGLNRSLEHISQAARKALKKAGITSVTKAAIGLAGLDTPTDRQNVMTTFKEKYANPHDFFGARQTAIVSDALIGLYSGKNTNHGVCIISGTGSNVYGLTIKGKEARAGDWGYLLGDQGSGYAMGLAILREVMQEFDGRSDKTILTDKVLSLLNLKNPHDLVEWAYYQDRVVVEDIAKISQLCIDPEIASLEKIGQIIDYTANELIHAYRAVTDKLQLASLPDLPVVLVGGVMMHHDRLRPQIKKGVANLTPNAQVTLPIRSPAEGAALMVQTNCFGGQLPNSAIIIE